MADWTSLDWRALNFAIMLSTKSSIILDSAYASAEASQRAAWLGKCLDTLCLRAQELNRLKGEECSYFNKLAQDWANVKSYYQNCTQRTFSASTTVNTTQRQPQLPAQTQQPTSNAAYMDATFDVDPFNELFWAGFGEADVGAAAIY
jgi:hypothetical protein